MLYAHRGASFELPENTLAAFRLALELGADALETDAHLTKDGAVVLSHDSTGERMAGIRQPIRDATLEEVRGWDVGARFVPRGRDGRGGSLAPFRMPTLEEALEELPGVLFNVDAKSTAPEMIPALLHVVRRANATARVRIASFSLRNLRRARALGYEGETGLAPAEVATLLAVPTWIGRRIVRGNAAQIPRREKGVTLASPRVVGKLQALGLRVDFWTIDDPEEARRLFAMGANGVMTDDPRTMAVVAGKRG